MSLVTLYIYYVARILLLPNNIYFYSLPSFPITTLCASTLTNYNQLLRQIIPHRVQIFVFLVQIFELLDSTFNSLLFHTQLCPLIHVFHFFHMSLSLHHLCLMEAFLEITIEGKIVQHLFIFNNMFLENLFTFGSMLECLVFGSCKIFFDVFFGTDIIQRSFKQFFSHGHGCIGGGNLTGLLLDDDIL